MEIKTFKGNQNLYAEIATRGDQKLALSLEFWKHHSETGCLLFRFVAVAPNIKSIDIKSFKQLKPRQYAMFKKDEFEFAGIRLTKCAIPVFNPSPGPIEFVSLCDKFQVWEIASDWVIERCTVEGFNPIDKDGMPTLLKNLVEGILDTGDDNYKLVLQFPDFSKQKEVEIEEEGQEGYGK